MKVGQQKLAPVTRAPLANQYPRYLLVCVSFMAQIWRSENNLWSLLFFYYIGSRGWIQVVRWQAPLPVELFFTFLKQSRFATRLSCNLQFSWLSLPNADVTGRHHHLTVLSFRSVLFSLHLLLSVFLVSLSALTSLTSLCILPSPVARHSPHGHAVPYAPSLDSGGEDWCHALGLLPGSVTSGGKCPLYSDGAHSRTCTRPWVSSPLP